MVTLRAGALCALASFLALAAACGGGGGEEKAQHTPVAPRNGQVNIIASEWKFEPDTITIEDGEEVLFVFENQGRVLHDIKVEDMPADVLFVENLGPLQGDEDEVFVSAESGGLGQVQFVPLTPGTYTFYCTVAGHRELGMEGTLIVEPFQGAQ